jgi:integrase/recombinase XerD
VSDLVVIGKETLTPVEFQKLADVPPEIEWRANITNPKTRRFYKNDVAEFLSFTGPQTPRRCAPWRGRMSSPGARI